MSLQIDTDGELLRTVVSAQGMSKPVVLSYNYLINERLPKLISSTALNLYSRTQDAGGYARFTNVRGHLPVIYDANSPTKTAKLYPMRARREGLSYMADISATLEVHHSDGSVEREDNVFIGKFPIMIGCKLDRAIYEKGADKYKIGEWENEAHGYFIIKGAEKVLLHIDKVRNAIPLIYMMKDRFTVRYTSKTLINSTVVQMASVNKVVLASFTGLGLSIDVNVLYLFYVLGISQDNIIKRANSERGWVDKLLAIMEWFVVDEDPARQARRRKEMRYYFQFTVSAFAASTEMDPQRIMNLFAEKFDTKISGAPNRDQLVTNIVRHDLFDNVKWGNENVTVSTKIKMLAAMTVKLIEFHTGYRSIDDRDSWGYKRIVDPANHMEAAMVTIWTNYMKKLKDDLLNKNASTLMDVKKALSDTFIGEAFIKNFGTEVWNAKKNADKSQNIAIVDTLSRTTIMATASHVRRLNSPINKSGKNRDKRLLHNTQWGFVCPVKTPEGGACGLVKAAAMTSWISLERDIGGSIGRILKQYGTVYPFEEAVHPVYFNGTFYGFANTVELHKVLIAERRQTNLPFDVGIVLFSNKELRIATDSGRFCRPLAIVDELSQRLVIDIKGLRNVKDLNTLMREGCIEYIDALEQEQEYIHIASSSKFLADNPNMTVPFTHCEIDPTAMFGVSASITPFPEFMPGVRNAYQAQMSEQALTSNAVRNDLRFDTTMVTIVNPGVPLVTTNAHEMLGMDEYPQGNNVMIAVMVNKYNQEDAIVINRASLNRGLFKYLIHHKHETELERKVSILEVRKIPEYSAENAWKYANLETDPTKKNAYGIVKLGSYVKEGEVLVAKSWYDKSTNTIRDTSLVLEVGKKGYVDEVIVTTSSVSRELIRIRIVEYREVQAGDKFASRFAQKGIAARILPEEDMPFNEQTGEVPDVLFSPLSVPSRMTINKLMEIFVGRLPLYEHKRFNATGFRRDFDVAELEERMAEHGLSNDGKEWLYNGETGELIEAKIFTGVVYYQALKHLVEDKMQARGIGMIDLTTHQPVGGMRKGGGLKLGNMERDAMIAHGASYLIQERLSLSSDAYTTIMCNSCGTYAINNPHGEIKCRTCNDSEFVKVQTSFIYKVFQQILAGANIKIGHTTRTKTLLS